MARITPLLHWVIPNHPHSTPRALPTLCGVRIGPAQEAQTLAQITCKDCLRERLRQARLDLELDQL